MLFMIRQWMYAAAVVALVSVFLVQMNLVPNWRQIWQYLKTQGFSFTNFKVAFKTYMQ